MVVEDVPTSSTVEIPAILPKKKAVKIELPEVLMDILVKDAEIMNSKTKSLKVPMKKTLSDILDDVSLILDNRYLD